MAYYWTLLRAFIINRLPQLLIRYVGILLAYLTAHGVIIKPEDATGFTNTVVAVIMFGVSVGLDWLWHYFTYTPKKDAEVVSVPPKIVSLLIVGLLLGTLAGCKFSDKLAAYSAAAATAVATHTAVSVSVDPNTGEFTANIAFKDAQGRDAVEKVSMAELKRRCEACNDHAQAELKASYQRALDEMAATQKTELAKLKAARKKCPNGMCQYQTPDPALAPLTPNPYPLSPAVPLSPASANRFVVVGDNYPGTGAQLGECVNDANKMVALLTQSYGLAPSELKVLTDAQCTAANLKSAITWAFADIKPGDKRGVYISGHGAEDTDANGNVVDLIVTYDMVSTNRWDESTEVTLDFWKATLSAIPPGCNGVVMLDTCHSGGAVRPLTRPGHTIRSIDGPAVVQARVNASATRSTMRATVDSYNCAFIAACGAGQVSEETPQTGGAFTCYFIEAVNTLGPATSAAKLTSKAKQTLKANAFQQSPEAHGATVAKALFEAGTKGDFRPY